MTRCCLQHSVATDLPLTEDTLISCSYGLHESIAPTMPLVQQQIISDWLDFWQMMEAAACPAGMDAAGAGQSSNWGGPASAGGPSQVHAPLGWALPICL